MTDKTDKERLAILETKMGFLQAVAVVSFGAAMTALIILISQYHP